MDIDATKIFQQISTLIATYGLKLLLSIFILWVGFKIINIISKGVHRWFEKSNYDRALGSFVFTLVASALKILLIITCVGIAGFPTTSLVAMLGAAGLAVGMALSGTLQNFAGGILLLVLKPFKIGDFIETSSYRGKVKRILIFNTIITTPDNKRILLPNGPVATGAITNFSTEPKRRVDFVFGIGYNDDIDKARAVIKSIINSDSRIDKDPEPLIAVHGLGDNAVELAVRVWTNSADYWDVFFALNESVKKSFDKEGISFPFPQREVHVFNQE